MDALVNMRMIRSVAELGGFVALVDSLLIFLLLATCTLAEVYTADVRCVR
ncbi:MAG: hypothetical protein AB8B79_04445 [Granulosicoccus sp.]